LTLHLIATRFDYFVPILGSCFFNELMGLDVFNPVQEVIMSTIWLPENDTGCFAFDQIKTAVYNNDTLFWTLKDRQKVA